MGSLGYKVIQVNLETKDVEYNNNPNEIQLNQTQIASVLVTSDPKKALNHDFASKIVQLTELMVTEFKGKGLKFVTTAECITGGYRE